MGKAFNAAGQVFLVLGALIGAGLLGKYGFSQGGVGGAILGGIIGGLIGGFVGVWASLPVALAEDIATPGTGAREGCIG